MDYEKQQLMGANGEIDQTITQAFAEGDFEGADDFENARGKFRWTARELGILRQERKRADRKGLKGLLLRGRMKAVKGWLLNKRKLRKADGDFDNASGIEDLQMLNAVDEPTVQPNKFIKTAVWAVIALGTGLFILHAIATLKKLKTA